MSDDLSKPQCYGRADVEPLAEWPYPRRDAQAAKASVIVVFDCGKPSGVVLCSGDDSSLTVELHQDGTCKIEAEGPVELSLPDLRRFLTEALAALPPESDDAPV